VEKEFMKGIILRQYLEFVETNYGPETVEKIIEESQLSSQGAYTNVGTYSYEDILHLTKALSEIVNLPIERIVRDFGQSLFQNLMIAHPQYQNLTSVKEMLAKIHNVIHVEVRKLYPDAALPDLDYSENEDGSLSIHYKSERPFATFALGLIMGCVDYYKESYKITRLSENPTTEYEATFRLVPTNHE
jgi:hypothetical protein